MEMFQMNVSSAVCMLWNTLRPKQFSRDEEGYEEGLIVRVDLRLFESPGSDNGCCAELVFLFAGDTSVWVASCPLGGWGGISLDSWDNVSNHDSCWSDGVEREISKLYFRFAKEINPNKAPVDMHQFCDFGFGKAWERVKVKYERDRKGPLAYRMKVIDVKTEETE
jgi:hypothetical protein